MSQSGESYLVDAREGACECPDHEYRDVQCKHLRRVAFATGERAIPGWVERYECVACGGTGATRSGPTACGRPGLWNDERRHRAAAVGAAGPHATDAFELVGNETRLAILLALWEAYDPHAERTAVTFSDLRDRVGIRDSGQFNYHLGKLEGQFVRKTDDGYELRRSGFMLVQSIIAATGIEDPAFGPIEVDAPCERCGAPTAITYDNVYVYQVCTECTGSRPPGDEHPPACWSGGPSNRRG